MSNDDEFFNSIEKLRQKLLDLTGKNNSISFKHSNRTKKQIRFIDEVPNQIFERLLNEEDFELIGIPVPDLEPEDEKTESFKANLAKRKKVDEKYLASLDELGVNPSKRKVQALDFELRNQLRQELGMLPVDRSKRPPLAVAAEKIGLNPSFDLQYSSNNKKHKDKYIQTLLYQDELELMLDGIVEQRKLIESETGTEPLYIALGFLEWYESESSDKALQSPLIFLPVTLDKEKDEKTGSYKYTLQLRETEAYMNFSLRERFLRDFGFSLPDIEYSDDEATHYLTPLKYFEKISQLIKDKKDWSLKNWATMSFFSFTKLAMYQELEKAKLNQIANADTPLEQLIHGTEIKDSPMTFAPDYNIESPEFKNKVPHLISIADTSQISAIIDATESKNLVIEGPPGTGKSQTITNMIASLVDSGKSVLFVAEKRAALTVVKDRLSQAGLGPFCLELHSGKSKKTEVLKSISERFEAKGKRAKSDLDELNENIDELKKKISNYLGFLHEEFEPLGVSLQDIMWTLLNVKYKNPEVDSLVNTCEIKDVNLLKKWDIQKIELVLNTLSTEYDSHISEYKFVEYHPWHNLVDTDILSIDIPNFLKDLQDFQVHLSDLQNLFSSISIKTANDSSLEDLKNTCTAFAAYSQSSNIDASWAKNLIKSFQEDFFINIEDLLNIIKIKSEALASASSISINKNIIEKGSLDLKGLINFVNKHQLNDLTNSELLEALKKNETEKLDLIEHYNNLKSLANTSSESERNATINSFETENSVLRLKLKSLTDTVISATAYYNEVCKILNISEPLSVVRFNKLGALKKVLATCPLDKWNMKDSILMDSSIRIVFKKLASEGIELAATAEKLKEFANIKVQIEPHELRMLFGHLTNSGMFKWFSKDYRDAVKRASNILYRKDNVYVLLKVADYIEKKQQFEASLNKKSIINLNLDSNSDFSGLLQWISFYESVDNWNSDFTFAPESIDKILCVDSTKIVQAKQKINESSSLSYSDFTDYTPSESSSLEPILMEIENKQQQIKEAFADNLKKINDKFQIDLTKKLQELELKSKQEIDSKAAKIEVLKNALFQVSEIELFDDVRFSKISVLLENINAVLKCNEQLSQHKFQKTLAEVPNILNLYETGKVDEIKTLFNLKKDLKLSEAEFVSLLDEGYGEWFSKTLIKFDKILNSLNSIDSLASRSGLNKSAHYRAKAKDLLSKVTVAMGNRNAINGYIDYSRSFFELNSYSHALGNILDIAKNSTVILSNFYLAFRISYYTSIVKNHTRSKPAYFKSVSTVFNEYREKFRVLDNELSDAYRIHLYNKLLSRTAPQGIARGKKSEYTECGLLEYQIKLKRPNVPVRSLMQRASESIQTLKPIFLMSPLSVAQLLPDKHIQFDVVIMDEASQMRPEDSLGSIARAKQVIIVGDPKQMPPSDFFSRSGDDSNPVEEENHIDVQEESILDLGLNVFKPARRLKWHYRSRSEKLIAFSNKHFYDSDLIIFPSAYNGTGPMGVEYKKIEGSVYNKGTNPIEAKITIERAISLIHQYPNKSMMVVAMNKAQSELMQELLSEMEKNDPIVEEYRAKFESTLEPFLIRNLENVQGDERDIVIISTVYGPDSNGHVFQRFGPINSEYGHRRLNVLFTRAKYYMNVISSLDPDKIVVTNGSTQGVVAFKNFLSYAKTGRLGDEVISAGDREPDSDFEIFVAKKLQEKMPHLKIVPQVGVAGFFVDIGIRHPDKEGAFLLGIECDGKAYHSAKSARDRDKIRQKVLEDLGWNLHRIWSTDWFNDPDYQVKKLIEKINFLLKAS